MTLSMPVLAAIGIVVAVLALFAFRRRGDTSHLMGPPRDGLGGQRPAAPPRSAGPQADALTPQAERQVRELLAAGQKINAVKLVRQETGLGLKEALDLVDAL